MREFFPKLGEDCQGPFFTRSHDQVIHDPSIRCFDFNSEVFHGFYCPLAYAALKFEGLTREDTILQNSLPQLYDAVILPALTNAEQDRRKGVLESERGEFLFLSVREMLAEFSEKAQRNRPCQGASCAFPLTTKLTRLLPPCWPKRDVQSTKRREKLMSRSEVPFERLTKCRKKKRRPELRSCFS